MDYAINSILLMAFENLIARTGKIEVTKITCEDRNLQNRFTQTSNFYDVPMDNKFYY